MPAQDPDNTIAFQGVRGAHSDLACQEVEPYMNTMPCAAFEDVFKAVDEGHAKYGLIPMENSYAGRVAEIHNILPETNLHIVGEYFHSVHHHLMGVKGATLEDIKTVTSHAQALMQCRKFIYERGLEQRPASDTAGAAEAVAEAADKQVAAIASELAAELYGLDILAREVEDHHDNVTLFIKLAREPYEPAAQDERLISSGIFTTRNLPAGLYKALGGFATNNVNLLKLESYIPDYASGTAQFFITFEGNPEGRNVQLALEELGFFTHNFKLLGVYPADERRFGS